MADFAYELIAENLPETTRHEAMLAEAGRKEAALDCPVCGSTMDECPHEWVNGYWRCRCYFCGHGEVGTRRNANKARMLRGAQGKRIG